MKEYKPILVFYFKEIYDMQEWDYISKEIEKVKENSGYSAVISMQGCLESRVEIISVDKATVVEDIQKYIDLQSIKEKEDLKIPHVSKKQRANHLEGR